MKEQYMKILKDNNLNYLYHFTNIVNLDSILKHGILSVQEMKERNIKYSCTDPNRNDNQLDCISLSLSKANTSMLFAKRMNIDSEWIIFEIEAGFIINEYYDSIYYCKYNAASQSTIKFLKEHKDYMKSPNAFQSMFDNNRKPFPQSEILLKDKPISLYFITKIYVQNMQIKMIVEQIIKMNNYPIPVEIKEEMF